MFKVSDQVQVNLVIDGIDVVEDIQNLELVEVIETADGALPEMSASFRTTNEALVAAINERSTVQMGLGDDFRDMADSAFTIQKHNIRRSGNEWWAVELAAVKDTLAKWTVPRVEISGEMSGIERIREVAARSDRVVANAESSRDRQRWIQYGCQDRMHVQDILLHCDLGESFPMMASVLDGFRIYDAGMQFAKAADQGRGPDWTLSVLDTDIEAGAIAYDIDAGIDHMSGMFNAFGARGHVVPVYSADTGASSVAESSPASRLSLTRQPDVSDDFSKVSDRRRVLTRNMHPRYWDAWAHNHTQLGLYSSSGIAVSWRNRYEPVHPLDVVMFKDRDIGENNAIQAVHSYSGLYIVARVARSFDSSTFNTTVQLTREALNA